MKKYRRNLSCIGLFVILFFTGIQAQNGTWDTEKIKIPVCGARQSSCVIDGKIYLFGGYEYTGVEADCRRASSKVLVYDPEKKSWDTNRTPMPTARAYMAIAVVDEKVYLFGGSSGHPTKLRYDIVEVYDPQTDTWDTSRAPMPTIRFECKACVYKGRIFVIGGKDENSQALGAVELYDPESDTWEVKAPMPTPRGTLALELMDGKIIAIGGNSSAYPFYPDISTIVFTFSVIEFYNIETNEWQKSSYSLPEKTVGLGSAQYGGNLYLFGGHYTDANDNTLRIMRTNVYLLNLSTETFVKITELPTPRCLNAAHFVNGKFYIPAGENYLANILDCLQRYIPIIEVYTPVKDPVYAMQSSIDGAFIMKDTDSLLIQSRFVNPKEFQFNARAVYKANDGSFIDSIELFDDGMHDDGLAYDGLYGNYCSNVRIENQFTIDIVTTNLNSGEQFYTVNDELAFTSIGPVSVEEVLIFIDDSIRVEEHAYRIKLMLKNSGAQATANKITAEIFIVDDRILINYERLDFGPILAGTIATSNNAVSFTLNPESSLDQPVILNISISSNGIPFWHDNYQIDLNEKKFFK